jgi:hypothetical protein
MCGVNDAIDDGVGERRVVEPPIFETTLTKN